MRRIPLGVGPKKSCKNKRRGFAQKRHAHAFASAARRLCGAGRGVPVVAQRGVEVGAAREAARHCRGASVDVVEPCSPIVGTNRSFQAQSARGKEEVQRERAHPTPAERVRWPRGSNQCNRWRKLTPVAPKKPRTFAHAHGLGDAFGVKVCGGGHVRVGGAGRARPLVSDRRHQEAGACAACWLALARGEAVAADVLVPACVFPRQTHVKLVTFSSFFTPLQ